MAGKCIRLSVYEGQIASFSFPKGTVITHMLGFLHLPATLNRIHLREYTYSDTLTRSASPAFRYPRSRNIRSSLYTIRTGSNHIHGTPDNAIASLQINKLLLDFEGRRNQEVHYSSSWQYCAFIPTSTELFQAPALRRRVPCQAVCLPLEPSAVARLRRRLQWQPPA